MIAIVLATLAAYLGWTAGRRWERGKMEDAAELLEEQQLQRSQRSGTVVLNTIQIRR